MEMYYLNKYDYENKTCECIYYDTFINVKHELKKVAYELIKKKNKDKIEYTFNDVFFKNNCHPDFKQIRNIGEFYILESTIDENIYYINMCDLDRGFWSTYYDRKYIINHIYKFSISKANKKVMDRYWGEKFTNQKIYKEVLLKLEKIYDEAQNNKLYEDIFEGTKSDETNYYTEYSNSPIELNDNNSTDY